MATDLERLVVQLSADVKGYEREMRRASGVTDREARKIEKRFAQTQKSFDNVGRGIARSLTVGLGGLGAAFSAREVIRYADAWTIAGNKIKAAGQVAGREGRSLEGINDIANASRAGLTETAGLYATLLRATAGVAKSELEVARATEIVNKAFKAGGAAASEQAAGVLQLGQALSSGLLQGDELRSLRENAPLIAQAIADEFETTIGGLKELGAEGELTADRVFKAILNAQPQIEAAFQSTNQTIGDSFTKLNNQFTRYIGQSDESLGASQRLISGLNALADNFDATADAVVAFASIVAAGLLGRSIAGMIAQLGLASGALVAFIANVRKAQTIGALAVSLGGLGAAAGPIGLALGAAAGAALYFASGASEAETSADELTAEMLRLGLISDRASKQIDGAADSIDKLADGAKAQKLRQIANEIARLNASEGFFDNLFSFAPEVDTLGEVTQRVVQLRGSLANLFSLGLEDRKILGNIGEISEGLRDGEISAEDALRKLDEFKKLDLASPVEELISALEGVIERTTGLIRLQDRYNSSLQGAVLPDQRGDDLASQRQARRFADDRQQFLADRLTQSGLSEDEKRIQERTQQIIKESADQIGTAISEAQARQQAVQELGIERTTRDFDSAIDKFVDRVISAESGGDVNAKNPNSTATGAGQFIESTWLDLFKRYFPERAKGLTDGLILAARSELGTTRTLIEAYSRENAAVLQKAGVAVDEAALQLAYFLGPNGAVKVLQAPSGTPIEGLLGDAAIKANPTILGGGATVDDVRAYAEARAGLETVRTRSIELQREEKQIIDETLASLRQSIELNQLEAETLGLSTYERERARAALELEQALKSQGIVITDQLRAAIQAEADAYAASVSGVEAKELAITDLQAAQEELIRQEEEIAQAFAGAAKGFVQDLIAGRDATEALADAVGKLGQRLIDLALDQIFASLFQGGGVFGGIIGAIAGGGFAKGGYTGQGGKYEPAGVVHKGEYVFDKAAVDKIGVKNLEAIRRGMAGYADGGLVAPSLSRMAGGDRSTVMPAPVVNQTTRIVNTFDAASYLDEALNSPAGERILLNHIRSRPGAYKAVIST